MEKLLDALGTAIVVLGVISAVVFLFNPLGWGEGEVVGVLGRNVLALLVILAIGSAITKKK